MLVRRTHGTPRPKSRSTNMAATCALVSPPASTYSSSHPRPVGSGAVSLRGTARCRAAPSQNEKAPRTKFWQNHLAKPIASSSSSSSSSTTSSSSFAAALVAATLTATITAPAPPPSFAAASDTTYTGVGLEIFVGPDKLPTVVEFLGGAVQSWIQLTLTGKAPGFNP